MTPKSKLILGLTATLAIIALVGLGLKGNSFKGSFDVKDDTDVKLTLTVPTGDFKTTPVQNATYSLDKDVKNIFVTIKNKSGKVKILPLKSSDFTAGSHTISLDSAQFPGGFSADNAPFEFQMIAYNSKNEISDIQKGNIAFSTNSGSGMTLKTDTSKPAKPSITSLEEGKTYDVTDIDKSIVKIAWTDSNTTSYQADGDKFIMSYGFRLLQWDAAASSNKQIWPTKFTGPYPDQDICVRSITNKKTSDTNQKWVCQYAKIPDGIVNYILKSTKGKTSYTFEVEGDDGVTKADISGVSFSITNGDAENKGVHKTANTKPATSVWAAPIDGAAIDLNKDNGENRLVITWKDDENKTQGARQIDANGYYRMNYRWKLAASKIITSVDFEKAPAIPGASVEFESGFPVYEEGGGDIQSSSTGCIKSMTSDGKSTGTNRWTCTEAIIPYDALKALTSGDYTLGVQADDGVTRSDWAVINISLKAAPVENKAPPIPTFISPAPNTTFTLKEGDNQTISLQWSDTNKEDTTPGPEKNASGVFTNNYKWFVVKGELKTDASGKKVTDDDITTAIGSSNTLFYGVSWHDEAKFKTAGVETEKGCIQPTTDINGVQYQTTDGTKQVSWVCTAAVIPADVVKTMASGSYTAIVYAGDGALTSFALQTFKVDNQMAKDLGLGVSIHNSIQDENSGDMYVQLQVEKISDVALENGSLNIKIQGQGINKSYDLRVEKNHVFFANYAVPSDSVTVNGNELKASLYMPPGPGGSQKPQYSILPAIQIKQSTNFSWTLKYTSDSGQIQTQKDTISVTVDKSFWQSKKIWPL